MSYGLSRNTGHGRRAPRHRYRPDLRRKTHERIDPIFPHIPGTGVGSTAAEGAIAFAGFAILGPILVGFGLYLLAEAATRFLRKAKNGAAKSDLASRKALHVLHDHARHRAPTAEMLRKYWLASRTSLEGRLLLGSLLGDLSVTVDASYVRGEGGEIVGRQGGIRGWMEKNAPDMLRHYKTLMHYKAVADKFRLYCGVQEPDGAEEALGLTIPEHAATALARRQRHPKAAELLARCRTMTALHAVVCDGLGLVRVRRRTA